METAAQIILMLGIAGMILFAIDMFAKPGEWIEIIGWLFNRKD